MRYIKLFEDITKGDEADINDIKDMFQEYADKWVLTGFDSPLSAPRGNGMESIINIYWIESGSTSLRNGVVIRSCIVGVYFPGNFNVTEFEADMSAFCNRVISVGYKGVCEKLGAGHYNINIEF